MLGVGRVRSKKKNKSKKNNKKSAPPKTHHDIHSSPATATARDGERRNTSHALAYTRPLSKLPGLWKSASYSSRNCLWQKRPRSRRSFGLFFLQQMVQKEKQPMIATSNRHSDPHSASHSFKAARSRWKEFQTRSELGVTSCRPLWALHRLGRRESRRYPKQCKPHLVLPPFGENPNGITRHTVAIRHRSNDHHSRCPLTDPLPACCYRRQLVRPYRCSGCTWCLGEVTQTKFPLGRESRMKGFDF